MGDLGILDPGICFDRFLRERLARISRRHAFPHSCQKVVLSFGRALGLLAYGSRRSSRRAVSNWTGERLAFLSVSKLPHENHEVSFLVFGELKFENPFRSR
jgi:hypothetical protein